MPLNHALQQKLKADKKRHLQLNIIDSSMLKEAQQNPDE